jgi:Ner family transcriptional regulator
MGRHQPQGWHREDIKAALRKRHGSLEKLSTSWGYHKSTVAVALNPGSYIPTVERRIAAELGQHPHTLWPDRWTPDGTPKSVAERNITPPAPAAHRPKDKAA